MIQAVFIAGLVLGAALVAAPSSAQADHLYHPANRLVDGAHRVIDGTLDLAIGGAKSLGRIILGESRHQRCAREFKSYNQHDGTYKNHRGEIRYCPY